MGWDVIHVMEKLGEQMHNTDVGIDTDEIKADLYPAQPF